MAHILLIDDDPYLTDDLAFFIEEKGHECTVYKSADQVMEDLDDLDKFDLIILDIMMMKGKILPDDESNLETGELLFEEIRNKYKKKRIIVISAMDFDEMTVKFSSKPHVQILKKVSPDENIDELLEMIG